MSDDDITPERRWKYYKKGLQKEVKSIKKSLSCRIFNNTILSVMYLLHFILLALPNPINWTFWQHPNIFYQRIAKA